MPKPARLAKIFSSPSGVKSETVNKRLDDNVGVTYWSIQALKALTSQENVQNVTTCATQLVATLRRFSEQKDGTGLASKSAIRAKGEVAWSSAIAECCGRYLGSEKLRWYHQMGTTEGVPDIVVAFDDGTKLQPVAVVEFGFLGDEKKWQCLAYGSNLTHSVVRLLECTDVPILAMTWGLNKDELDQGQCVLRVVGASPYAAEDDKFSAIDVWAGDVNVANVALLLQAIITTATATQASAPPQEAWTYHGQNVAICRRDDTGNVFKLYDYRPSVRGVDIPQQQRRNFELLQRKLGAVVVVKAPDLVLLKYNYVEGDHHATSARQFKSAIEALRELHKGGIVHGDVRALNMLFAEERCTFIDYDFAGMKAYPANYVSTGLHDVGRHNDAVANRPPKEEHDWFALASVMEMHECVADVANGTWEKVCEDVRSGNVDAAIAAIDKLDDQTLEPIDALKSVSTRHLGTGRPPRTKMQPPSGSSPKATKPKKPKTSSNKSSSLSK